METMFGTQEEGGGNKEEIFITEEDDDDADDEQRLVISDDKHTDSPSSSSAADEDAMNILSSDTQKFVKSDEETASVAVMNSPQKETVPRKNAPDNAFSWPEYLQETGAVAAPDECFYQDPAPPKNMFAVRKKVEVPDPRGSNVQCLATIVAVHSLWICVRLDGEDKSNDRWLICDDQCIRPVGECESKGKRLQPPYGFMYSLATFHKFIENQLKPEKDGSIPAAPLESFAPISSDHHPKRNKFQVGMKCEAIDRRNFNGRPCPATVIDVKGDYLTISYDGWNKAYDVTERYDSRFIFPVGWAAKCGLEMQPPNRVKGRVIQRITQKDVSSEVLPTVAPKKPKILKRKSTAGSNAVSQQSRKRKTKSTDVTLRNSSVHSRSFHLQDVINKVAKQNKMELTPACNASSSNNVQTAMISRLESLNDPSVPRARKTIPSLPKVSPSKKSHKTNSSPDITPSSFASSDIILSTMDGQSGSQKMTVYLNRNCRCAPMLNAVNVCKMPDKIGPGCLHHILRETIQQIVNCAVEPSIVFSRLEPGTPRILSVTAEINGQTHVHAIPAVKTVTDAWSYLHGFIAKLDVCCNFVTEKPVSCSLCSCSSEDGVVSTTAGGGCAVKCGGGESDDPEDYEGRQQCDLTEWSMERVAAEVENMFDASIADRFLQNQIDGKALMLLTTELLIRHLEMPFGPALKMMAYIDSLRGKVPHTDSRNVK